MTAPTAAALTAGAAAPPRTALAWGLVHRADVAADGRITGSIARPTRHGSPAHAERHYAIQSVEIARAEDQAAGRDPSVWLLAWHDGDRWHTTDNIPGDTR
ncbi:hypothetical protein [Embleya hyalina]|uniref:Uncharacterized protein n=1 Tax=Embleya hyalina TaxID=516124 RepID=A0A401YHJ6_9ACTN|nr:hypothetical protein [Embleya hyalina]GCD94047.1 hypothetical protein EHYA_01703 [Embleya hyalina]